MLGIGGIKCKRCGKSLAARNGAFQDKAGRTYCISCANETPGVYRSCSRCGSLLLGPECAYCPTCMHMYCTSCRRGGNCPNCAVSLKKFEPNDYAPLPYRRQ